jgi:nucleoside-diphosphate-sugar epimerase
MIVKTILMTGSEGFVGSVLKKKLLESQYQIYCLVRNNKQLKDIKNLKYIKSDISKEINAPNKKYDVILHCAAQSPNPNIKRNNYLKDNIEATKNIIRFAKKNEIKKIIFLSSISIYGKINSNFIDEKSKITIPDKYGESKLICEQLLNCELKNFSSLSLRLPGVIGKRSVRNWLTRILYAIKHNRKIKVFNKGSLFNNTIHVEELCKFLVKMIKMEFKNHQVICLSTKNPITIERIIKLFMDNFNFKTSNLKYIKQKKKSFLINHSRAKKFFKYTPSSTKDSILRFIKENK